MKRRFAGLAGLLAASAALAAPKIESVQVKPNPAQFSGGKPPQVELAVSVSRGRFDSGGCEARLEFGDGAGRALDFGVASTRRLHHVYEKAGSYTLLARGAGSTPCEGAQQATLTVVGAREPAQKKPPAKKKAPGKKKPQSQ